MRCSPPVRMNRSGSGAKRERQIRRQMRFVEAAGVARVLREHAVDRLHDVPAPAVVGGDRQREAVFAAVSCSASSISATRRGSKLDRSPTTLRRMRFSCSLATSLLERAHEQLHQERDFVGRTAPVLAAEGEQTSGTRRRARCSAGHLAHRLEPAPMTGHARQEALLRPAAVAVHDDGDVTRHRAGAGIPMVLLVNMASVVGSLLIPPSGRLPWPAAACRSRRCSGR